MKKILLFIWFLFCAVTTGATPLEPWLSTTPTSNNLRGVTFGNGLFVAVGDLGTIFASTDGANWVNRSNPAGVDNVDLFAVTYGSKGFVAVGGTRDSFRQPVIWTSLDGVGWTHRDVSSLNMTFGNYFQAVTYGNGLYVAVGGNAVTNTAVTSTNGVNWTSHDSHQSNSGLYPLGGVAYGNGMFVAVGAPLITAPDGINWTQQNSSGWYRLYAVTFADGEFVAVGPYSRIGSTNGINWTVGTPATGDYINGVTYGDGYYLALGYTPCYTTNGINWTTQTNAVTGNAIAFGNGVFVAVDNSGKIYRTSAMPHLGLQHGSASQLVLTGLVPATCRIDACPDLTSGWSPLVIISLTNSPVTWTDSSSTNVSTRFYRVIWNP